MRIRPPSTQNGGPIHRVRTHSLLRVQHTPLVRIRWIHVGSLSRSPPFLGLCSQVHHFCFFLWHCHYNGPSCFPAFFLEITFLSLMAGPAAFFSPGARRGVASVRPPPSPAGPAPSCCAGLGCTAGGGASVAPAPSVCVSRGTSSAKGAACSGSASFSSAWPLAKACSSTGTTRTNLCIGLVVVQKTDYPGSLYSISAALTLPSVLVCTLVTLAYL
jgi:hypothetical protein